MKVKGDIIMYITSIVFTLIAWGAGLLLDANIHFGDPQGFLCLRCCCPFWLWDFACCGQLKRISATEINETERVRFTPLKDGRGKSLWSVLIVKRNDIGLYPMSGWRVLTLKKQLVASLSSLGKGSTCLPMAQRIIPTPYLRSSAKIAKIIIDYSSER